MITVFQNIIRKNKKLVENFFSLSLLKGTEYLFPLITLPYLVRVLGPERYGLTIFAHSFVAFFGAFVDYGFDLSATRNIALVKNNKEKLSKIFSSVLIIKLFLFCISSVIFMTIITSFDRFKGEFLLYFFSYILVFGRVIFPVWFFQGIEKMKYLTIFLTISKTINLFLILIFIRASSDYLYVPLFSSLAKLAASFMALYFIFIKFKFNLLNFSWADIKKNFIEGWHFFTSTFFSNLRSYGNDFVLGLLASNEMVAYFAGAEKVIKAFRSLIAPISQSTYPHLSRLFSNTRRSGEIFIKKMGVIVGSISLLSSIATFVFAPYIIRLVLGAQFEPSVPVIRIMAILPLLIALTNIFGVQGLFAFGRSKLVAKILIIASFIHLPLFVGFTLLFSIQGSAIAVVVTELFITITTFIYFKKLIVPKAKLPTIESVKKIYEI